MPRNNKSKQNKQTEQQNMESTTDNNNNQETGEINESKDDPILPDIETLNMNSPDQNQDQIETMEEISNPVNEPSSAVDSNTNEFTQVQVERINKLHAEQNAMRTEVMFIKDQLSNLSNNQKKIESRLEASVGTLKERYSTLDSKLDSVIETLSAIKSNRKSI